MVFENKVFENRVFKEILSCIDGIYILEEISKEVVFVNDFISGGEQDKFIGRKCWEAMHDNMTQLFNRNQYTLDLVETYADVQSLGVLYFDLNNLKAVNDRYKHAAGDIIIKRMAEAMQCIQDKNIRNYRIGGDEFVVIYKNCSSEQLEQLRSAILQRLETLNTGQDIKCIAAVGMVFSDSVDDVESIVMNADKNMYLDKQNYKSGIK